MSDYQADLAGAYLARADLRKADLAGADLRKADLAGADLVGADLVGADLVGADLVGADLREADLREADLREADLREADLRGAYLAGATCPDGRIWDEYQADHLAGICDDPNVLTRAIAAWGNHEWKDCPMHEALGIRGFNEIPDEELRLRVAFWVACYDADLLQKPQCGEKRQ
jgi:hypothetical protein